MIAKQEIWTEFFRFCFPLKQFDSTIIIKIKILFVSQDNCMASNHYAKILKIV